MCQPSRVRLGVHESPLSPDLLSRPPPTSRRGEGKGAAAVILSRGGWLGGAKDLEGDERCWFEPRRCDEWDLMTV